MFRLRDDLRLKVPLVPCPRCGVMLTLPPWSPFVCPACGKLAHIPAVATA